jgi:hypothetical protein
MKVKYYVNATNQTSTSVQRRLSWLRKTLLSISNASSVGARKLAVRDIMNVTAEFVV